MLPALRGEQMSLHGRAVRLGSIVLLVGVLLHVPFGSTQGPADRTPSADIHEKQAILLGIQRSIAQLEGTLRATQEELRSPQGEGRREDLTQRIKTLGGKLAQLQENFNEVATFQQLIDPQRSIPLDVKQVHDIAEAMVREQPIIEHILSQFI
jgi:hypothetical protein